MIVGQGIDQETGLVTFGFTTVTIVYFIDNGRLVKQQFPRNFRLNYHGLHPHKDFKLRRLSV